MLSTGEAADSDFSINLFLRLRNDPARAGPLFFQIRGAEAFRGGHDGILSGSGGLVAQSYLALCYPMNCMQPTGLLCLWDFPGKNTGVGCYFFLQASSLFEPKLMLFLLMFYKNKWTHK